MALMKRSQVARGNRPPSQSDEKKLLDWANNLVEDGRNIRLPHEAQWWENIATYVGDIFSEFDPHKRRLHTPRRRRRHTVRLPINLAQPVVRTELAKLVKNRPIVDVLAASDDPEDLKIADVADKVLKNYVEKEYRMGRKRRRMLNWVLTCGAGGLFIDYDGTLNPIDVLSDANGNPVHDEREVEQWKQYWRDKHQAPKMITIPEGDLRIVPLSPFQLLTDLSQEDFDDASWCIVTEVYDCVEVERRWGVEVEPTKNLMPGVLEKRLLARFDDTSTLQLRDPKAQDLCEIHRLFVKPGHKYFPDGLHLVFEKTQIIDNETFPYEHGQLPVGWMGHIPLPGSQHDLSILQQIRPVVLEISKTESQMVQNRNLVANPPWRIADQHAIEEGKIENKPGLRLRYRHAPNVPPPEPVQMPDLPQYVKDLPDMLKTHVLEISGQGETSQGQVPAGARSGVAIAYLQEEDDTRLGPTVTAFEECQELTAFLILQNIAQFFEIPRIVRINKPYSQPEVVRFIGRMLQGIGGVDVQSGSALPRSKAAKQQYVLDLWDRQIEQDPRRLREMLELGQGEPDEWEIDMDQAERENAMLEQGEMPPVETWYNHQAHLFIHHRKMKSAEYEQYPDDKKQLYEEHCADHEREMQNAAASQAVTQGGQQPPNGGPPPGTPGANGGGPNAAPTGPYAGGGSPRDLMGDQPQ